MHRKSGHTGITEYNQSGQKIIDKPLSSRECGIEWVECVQQAYYFDDPYQQSRPHNTMVRHYKAANSHSLLRLSMHFYVRPFWHAIVSTCATRSCDDEKCQLSTMLD